MASQETQISAYVHESTKAELDAYVRKTGLKKGALVEAAILHHLQAARELPADVIIIPPRIVLSAQAGEDFLKKLAAPTKAPTEKLRALMARDDD